MTSNLSTLRFHLKGTGKYVPKQIVTSEDLDRKLGKPLGYVYQKSGVVHRYFASKDETTSVMACKAATQALAQANLLPHQLDCIISASGVGEQPIPCTASLVQKALSLSESGIPCFDINSTCLSFLTALDLSSHLINGNRFKNILIVSSDAPSGGLNWEDMESSTIFGDGAAAVVISQPIDEAASTLIAAHMETYSHGSTLCQIRGGGARLNPQTHDGDWEKLCLFEMDGKAVFRLVSSKIDDFLKALFVKTSLTLEDIDCIIPHQASKLAMHHLRKKLSIPDHKIIDIFSHHGNQVAASLPTALHEAMSCHKIKKGDKVLLFGSGAGVSMGGLIIEY